MKNFYFLIKKSEEKLPIKIKAGNMTEAEVKIKAYNYDDIIVVSENKKDVFLEKAVGHVGSSGTSITYRGARSSKRFFI